MQTPKIDTKKLDEVMRLIDKACDLMENNADERSSELSDVENRLRELTEKTDLNVTEFREYWGWTSLKDLAETVLMPVPEKLGLSDEKISEIVANIYNVKYSEAEMDYYLKLLEQETGLDNISDYIFYPDEVGLDMQADIPEIAAKILEDRKKITLLC